MFISGKIGPIFGLTTTSNDVEMETVISIPGILEMLVPYLHVPSISHLDLNFISARECTESDVDRLFQALRPFTAVDEVAIYSEWGHIRVLEKSEGGDEDSVVLPALHYLYVQDMDFSVRKMTIERLEKAWAAVHSVLEHRERLGFPVAVLILTKPPFSAPSYGEDIDTNHLFDADDKGLRRSTELVDTVIDRRTRDAPVFS